jgi:hypothetical protein
MTMPPASFVRLSTDQFAERDRIEAAREIIGRSLMKMEFELLPDVPFNVDMVFRALPDFAMASGICSAMDCLRTPELIESKRPYSHGCTVGWRHSSCPRGRDSNGWRYGRAHAHRGRQPLRYSFDL